jgi:hypothetical protein
MRRGASGDDGDIANIPFATKFLSIFFQALDIYSHMLLSHNTSSIQYGDIDLMNGMFISSSVAEYPIFNDNVTTPVRVFINIYGTFADLTGRFALHYDDLRIPTILGDCVIDPNYVRENIPNVGVSSMMEEEYFWSGMSPFPWYVLLMEEIYKISQGKYYFILPMFGCDQMDDRLTWVWRHFGAQAKDHTMVIRRSTSTILVRGPSDVYIGPSLKCCEDWTIAGGSSFWWPEMSIKCSDPAKLLAKRIKLLSQGVSGLRNPLQRI